MKKCFALKIIALCALITGAGAGFAQDVVNISNIVELSGGGATGGTNSKKGVELAVKEINTSGGILGKKIQTTTADTQSNPGIAKGLTKKAIDDNVFAIFGPVFSGSIMASFTQDTAMPKAARYITDQAKLKSIAVIYVNNDFGKGGLDALKRALANLPTKVLAEISTDSSQIDFSAALLKAKLVNPDGIFAHSNEDESARIQRELKMQGWTKPVIGETTLTGHNVIELAGDAANGAIAHVGLTMDVPIPAIRAFKPKFEQQYKYVSDHNGMTGYSGIYVLKAAIEKAGKLDRRTVTVTVAMKGLKVNGDKYPGALMYAEYDNTDAPIPAAPKATLKSDLKVQASSRGWLLVTDDMHHPATRSATA